MNGLAGNADLNSSNKQLVSQIRLEKDKSVLSLLPR